MELKTKSIKVIFESLKKGVATFHVIMPEGVQYRKAFDVGDRMEIVINYYDSEGKINTKMMRDDNGK